MQIGYRRITDRTGHDTGRQLLAEMYRRTAGEEMPPILTTTRGKPYFATGDLHFSITHTKHHVFCVLADRPVGIDAEETDRPIAPALAEKILSPAERQQYEQAADKQACLLRLWVLKEAAAKQTGEGLRGYPNQTAFSPEDPRIQILQGCYVAVIEE